MRIVIALGGNALLERGQTPDAAAQQANAIAAVEALAPLAKDHEVVLTHGNGPQVGVLALQSANDPKLTIPYPFDTLGAQTQGMIGYWLLQALQNELPGQQVAALVNQTLVSTDDPAFEDPTKFVGEIYDEATAKQFAEERGWTVKPDGDNWRRVVPSPRPQRLVETELVQQLLDAGTMVVCAGGGGVPVIKDADGKLQGIEAVIDKDATACMLAQAIDADALVILTDVEAVMTNFGTPDQAAINRATPEQLRATDAPAGSMGPKVNAVCDFVEQTDGMAAIGRLADVAAIIAGDAGTIITKSGEYNG